MPVPAAAAYVAPDTVSGLGLPASLEPGTQQAGCTIKLSRVGGGSFVPSSIGASNVAVHLFTSSEVTTGTYPKPTPGTENCKVTSYGFVDGVVTFTVSSPTATVAGTGQKFVVYVTSPKDASVAKLADSGTVAVTAPPWGDYILYQAKVSNPGWEKQLASFARPSATAFSTAYTAFVRATFDSSLYQDGGGTPWSNTTGLCSNMWLKPQYYGQQSDPWLIKNCSNQSCWVAPVSGLTGGLEPFVSQQWWDNAGYTSAFVRWGYTSSVTARSVGMCTVSMSTWGPATIVLRGFTSNAFSGGTTLVSFAASSVPVSGDGTGYGWFALSTTGSYSHYELSYSGAKHDHYTWAPILAAFT